MLHPCNYSGVAREAEMASEMIKAMAAAILADRDARSERKSAAADRKAKNANRWPGCVHYVNRNRSTGTTTSITDTHHADCPACTDAGRWLVVCEDHRSDIQTASRKTAGALAADPSMFCLCCQVEQGQTSVDWDTYHATGGILVTKTTER